MNNKTKKLLQSSFIFVISVNSFAFTLGSCKKPEVSTHDFAYHLFVCCKDKTTANKTWVPYFWEGTGNDGSLPRRGVVCSIQDSSNQLSSDCSEDTLILKQVNYVSDYDNKESNKKSWQMGNASQTVNSYCDNANKGQAIFDSAIPNIPITNTMKICTRWTNKGSAPTRKTSHNFPYKNTYDSVVATISTPEYIKSDEEEKDTSKKFVAVSEKKVKDPSKTITLPTPGTGWNCQDYSYSSTTQPSFSEMELTMTGSVTSNGFDPSDNCSDTGCMGQTYQHTQNFSSKFSYSEADYLKGCSINIDWTPSNDTSTIGVNRIRKLKGAMTDKDTCE